MGAGWVACGAGNRDRMYRPEHRFPRRGAVDIAIGQPVEAMGSGDSFFSYASRYHPEQLATIGRVLAIPPKRRPRNEICYLTDTEVTALLAAPDPDDQGRTTRPRDVPACVTAGLRVSELTGL